MNEKLRNEVLALVEKAQAEMADKNYEEANATMNVIKDKIKTPLPGEGTNGH